MATDLGIDPLMQVFQACNMQELWDHEGIYQDIKESLVCQAVCFRIRVPDSSTQ